MKALQKLMDKTSDVHIKGPGTDLRFSLKGLKSIYCGGSHNIPDGECFSAPVKDAAGKTIGVEARTAHEAFLRAFFPGSRLRTYENANALRTAGHEVNEIVCIGKSVSCRLNDRHRNRLMRPAVVPGKWVGMTSVSVSTCSRKNFHRVSADCFGSKQKHELQSGAST